MLKDTNEQPNQEIHRTKSERVLNTGTSVPIEFGMHHLQRWVLVQQPGSSPNLVLLDCCGGFITQAWWIKSLVTESTSIPSPLPRNQGVGLKVPTLYSWLIPCTTSPHPYVLSKSHAVNINPVVVERGLLWITRHHFTFLALKWFQELRTRDQILSQKMLPLLLSLRTFQGFWEQWAKMVDIWMTKYIDIFLINDNILPTYIVSATVDIEKPITWFFS